MIVLKFGGSSVATPERIQSIVEILRTYQQRSEPFTVVFSAFGGATDFLIAMSQRAARGDDGYLDAYHSFCDRHNEAIKILLNAQNQPSALAALQENHESLHDLLHGIRLLGEASARTMDCVLSFGERNAAYIIAAVLTQNGIAAAYLDARKVVKTDKNFGAAKVNFDETYKNIKEYYQSKTSEIQIVTGFIAATWEGDITTTLGRGGSDYTAAIFAAGLDAKAIEIWTDVDGVLTADPRKVKKAFTIPTMTFAEAMEMSHFGAKVIYPPTLQPALAKNIPLYIKNTFNPNFAGTYISHQKNPSNHAVQGISSISHIALFTLQGSGLFGVPGIAGRLFSSLAQAAVNIILITQGSSEHSITFAVQPSEAESARQAVAQAFEWELQSGIIEPLIIENEMCVLAIIGENMRNRPGVSGCLFQALGNNGINIGAVAQGSSELNISVVVSRTDESKALNAIHQAFFLSDTKELNLYIMGVGLIGGTLLAQIEKQAIFLKEKRALEIKIIGLANSRKMIFDENGMDISDWKEKLAASDEISNPHAFVQKMKSLNLPNAIFVDNTASDDVSNLYTQILDASISISTPNKIATSSAYLQYEQLKRTAEHRGVKFYYETNVGAGLPVISTLNDLINSGDQILKIEGILSGSLSFIFNSFKENTKFSDILLRAKELGLTEPDPRIDLNGIDVRRKIVILARETGLAMEPSDVKIQNILPPNCQNAETVADFYTEIEKSNDYFEQLRANAAADGKVLRMVAMLDGEQASIGLQAVASDHPFFMLNGSDNMIVFTTDRYKERPLVIRGPGAGAEVTAAGIFAEIITIGK